eukprot:CAMPEP_0178976508 /NCGR_PEP_ID=MMETSP0789-20121207/23879_1 /TAXON_ID=3005 /ORGANISM="Rhizosolenia setigera, Strain CCMP 1694" /LENGTH=244 /DNA_ID=CAMNT_0020665617 /DNA_START=198 /DNA_END=932 /DNA_ORIENTATION=-
MDEKYQKSTNTNNSTNMFRFHKSPIFANIDFDKLNIRKRDKKDASAKKFRVRVPFRIILWFILIFLMVPLGIGFHILIVKLSNRATGVGGVGNPTTVHLKGGEENPSNILTTTTVEGGEEDQQQQVLEEQIIGNDSQLVDAGTFVDGVGDRSSESQIINVVEKPPVDEILMQDEKIIIGQTAPQQQEKEKVIESQQQKESMNIIPQQQQPVVSEATTISETTTTKNNVVTETVQNQTISSRLDT